MKINYSIKDGKNSLTIEQIVVYLRKITAVSQFQYKHGTDYVFRYKKLPCSIRNNILAIQYNNNMGNLREEHQISKITLDFLKEKFPR